MTNASLLSVRNLRKNFAVHLGFRRTATVSAVDDVTFDVGPGETVGIVGESGCGKSTTARLIVGLAKPDSGAIVFDQHDLMSTEGRQRKDIKRGMQMVFQDPLGSVNPRMSIGENIGFPLKVNGRSATETRERTAHLLRQVGLHPDHASYFPHQLSGGQLQRVNTARALALEPKLIICDEPVSALDKSVQAQVLNLLLDLQSQFGFAYLFISHDLNVVEYVSDRVVVMYLGQVVEQCSSDELYRNPLHPYTRVLLSSIPQVDPDARRNAEPLSGEIPSAMNPPSGCRFRTRCPLAMDICATERPMARHPSAGHAVACHLYAPDASERKVA